MQGHQQQRIRPSIRDLTSNADYDQLAFPDIQVAAKVTRSKAPTIGSKSGTTSVNRTSIPDDVPSIPRASTASSSSFPAAKASKPKSRFALEREAREAAAAAQNGSTTSSNSAPKPKLMGDVIEREASTALPPVAPSFESIPFSPMNESRTIETGATGFPKSSHLLFPRKPQLRNATTSSRLAPSTPSSFDRDPVEDPTTSLPALLSSVSKENDQLLASMSEEEILQQQREIREEMGLSEDLLRILQKRAERKVLSEVEDVRHEKRMEGTSRPLPDGRARLEQVKHEEEEEEEGSPDYIRKHFFPNEPANPNLDWTRSPTATQGRHETTNSAYVFDLNGALLPSASNEQIPFASTSHHVSSSSSFTLPSLMSLTGSTVPSQRSTALSVLRRILLHPSTHESTLGSKAWRQFELDAITKAGFALRDSNVGVLSAALDLVASLFTIEREHPPTIPIDLAPGAEVPPTILSSFYATNALSLLAQHLSRGILPQLAFQQILSIFESILSIVSSASSSIYPDLEPLFSTPDLLEFFVKTFVSISWPPSSANHSASSALSLLISLAQSSRIHAKTLWDRKLIEPTLRFLSIPPWELGDLSNPIKNQSYLLITLTFELWQTLALYGLGTNLRTTSSSLLEPFFERISIVFSTSSIDSIPEIELSLFVSFLNLLSTWVLCAIDPHTTSHDILWSHISGWESTALQVHQWGLKNRQPELLTASWDLWESWLEGSKLNSGWKGEKERKWFGEEVVVDFKENGEAIKVVLEALRRMRTGTMEEKDVKLVLNAVRLSMVYEVDEEPSTPALFYLDGQLVVDSFDSIIPKLSNSSVEPSRSLVVLLVLLLRSVPSTSTRFCRTIDVLRFLRPGDEVSARDLIEWILRTCHPYANHSMKPLSELHPELELPYLSNVSILRSFLIHSIIAVNSGRVTGPLYPTTKDLRLTNSLHPFTTKTCLLGPDWPLSVLDELLRSGTSEVLKSLPNDFDSSELDLVRSSLALMRLIDVAGCQDAKIGTIRLIYDLIKIYMLEKNDEAPLTSDEVGNRDLFRDESVTYSIQHLIKPHQLSSHPSQTLGTEPKEPELELHSKHYSSSPLFQLYSDLLGLYDSISLSDPTFTLFLLPPLSMNYSSDYRKLFWLDYNHQLKNVRTKIDQIIITDLNDYLEPIESEPVLLHAYLNNLLDQSIKKEKNQFLYFVATHHLSKTTFALNGNQPRHSLIKALLARGSRDTVRALLSYEQVDEMDYKLRLDDDAFIEEGAEWERKCGILRSAAQSMEERKKIEDFLR